MELMILGMSTQAFTLLHVAVSHLAMASGIMVLCGLVVGQLYRRCNSLFLVTASLTSITGFAFPNAHITPGIIVGVLSLIALVLAAIALYAYHLNGAFRSTFVVSTTVNANSSLLKSCTPITCLEAGRITGSAIWSIWCC